MIDFPANPTVGQQFTAAGVTWTWDGTKWAASGLSVAYLPLTGGTLTGALVGTAATFSGDITGNLRFISDLAAGSAHQFIGRTSGSNRWVMNLGAGGAESGNNAGSDFLLQAWNDAGSGVLSNPISINRASGIVTIPNLNAPQAIGDNRIINGDMRIDQRNNGASGTANFTYTVDRWQWIALQTGKATWGRNLNAIAGPPGFPYYVGFQSASSYSSLAGDYFQFVQPIEADAVSDFNWGAASAQPVTLSFWAYSSLTGSFSGTITNYASTRVYPFTYSIPVANTWTKIVLTIPGDTAGTWVMSGNGGGVYLKFDLGSGATFRGPAGAWVTSGFTGVTGTVSVVAVNGATFYLTGVKLEVGSVATPFNRQSLAKSMADCQRYFTLLLQIQLGGYCNTTGNGPTIPATVLPVFMRAAPTLAVVGTSSTSNCSGISLGAPSNTSFVTFLTGVGAVGNGWWQSNISCSAEL